MLSNDTLYAIVDIETTGGYASGNGITEVAVFVHNGKEVIEQFETLVNPGVPIPLHIQSLTGISDEMVKDAPSFNNIAESLYQLLNDKVFVAHNVNFDYSFLHHQFNLAGYQLQTKKLCTVRLARKIFPGFPSYSLGKLCNQLAINIENRHRAGGDAKATSILFGKLFENDTNQFIIQSLKKGSKEASLPANLPKEHIENLPHKPGVYYFYDKKGKIIYIGKAVDLKKRVLSHFTNNKSTQQKQEFLREIFSITYVECGSELYSFVLEALEIKKYWPKYNRSLKHYDQLYGLYLFDAQNGYKRLAISKKIKNLRAITTFNSLSDGYRFLYQLIEDYELCAKLCFLNKHGESCSTECRGACNGSESSDSYNERVDMAIASVCNYLPTFAIIENGRTQDEQSCLLMLKGEFYGMGFITDDTIWNNVDSLKQSVTTYPSYDYIKNLIYQYTHNHPGKSVFY
ncbi:exonuclease domain-containing protein [Solitalea sp. MAHUQ-68]|uniref:Exonuclease domain-containing protein n=1 Tax=Solitalea agri TaxID=2953739 RepID=A0A9X2FB85_9SPHI|nr:exonuclease domain-containing protein [Solitalea agri]MCO4293713.1 exonuclease domain-containing protein [Solitalea agri]